MQSSWVLPRLIGLTVYQWDVHLRQSTIIGIVGAGGIGTTLYNSFSRYDYDFSLAILLVIVSIVAGESGTGKLLVFSQVLLSMQLSFAVFPLVQFTGERAKMGEFTNPAWLKALAWFMGLTIAALNAWLLFTTFREWLS